MLQSTKLAVAGIAGLVGGLCIDRHIISDNGNGSKKDINVHIGEKETSRNWHKSLLKVLKITFPLILTYDCYTFCV